MPAADRNSANRIEVPLLSGDGVGPELADVARICIKAVAAVADAPVTLVEYPVGYSAYLKTGSALPEETIQAMRNAPATLLAAMATKDCPPPSPMGQMRNLLGLFADIRHCVSGPGSLRPNINLILIRECSEGFLADRNMFRGSGEFMPTPDMVLSMRVITREKCDQIAKLAFEYARNHGRKKIRIAHKTVVFSLGCGLFRESVLAQARDYPEIVAEEESVDSLAGNLVTQPEQYDIILTTNLFGDILGDVAAAQVGKGVPIINASKDTALFYPSHGALKEMAGKQNVNPLGMMRTVSAMLHWLKLHPAARLLDHALSACDNAALGKSFILPTGITTSGVTEIIVRSIIA
jgi:3-isopropylmalate dehydrogenase